MTHYVFNEVVLYASKSGKCLCGKRRQRRQKFYQTLNPFNKNKQRQLKTRSEILVELQRDIKKWEAESIRCPKCKE